jgi:acetyl esterase
MRTGEETLSLHPQLVELLATLEGAGYPDQTTVPLDEARRITVDRARRYYGPEEPVDRVLNFEIPGPAGALPARLYAVAGENLPVVVYFHGGGWVLGDRDSHDKGVRALTNAAGCMSISVEYRLAPENVFPAAVDDCYAALCWVAENAGRYGGDGSRLAVAGDSAGGNLAAASALTAKAESGPALAFQLLIYPITDSNLDTPSYHEFADGPMLTAERMDYFWKAYVPDAAMRKDWRCAPMQAPDLSGLPPTMILAAPIDPLYSEGEAYAARLAEAGVAVEHVPMPGMCHAIFQTPALLDESRRGIDRAGAALKSVFWP